MRNVNLISVLLVSLLLQSIEPSQYVATFSNVVYPGIPLCVNIQILNATSDVSVTVELLNRISTSGDKTLARTQQVLKTGVPTPITLDVPDEIPFNYWDHFVRISGSGGAVFTNESAVRIEKERLFIYIQTDKTRYSAEQEVKFRVFHLLPNLLNYKGNSTVEISDGKGNRVSVLGPQQVDDGVIEQHLPLSDQPVFGTWKIQVTANGIDATKSFEVFDYVLPKFSVSIDIPSVKRTDSIVTVHVTARFTFDADVMGKCTLQFYEEYDTTKFVEYEKQISGSASFSIPMIELQAKLNMNSKINVRALVSDNATALTMIAEEELVFATDTVPVSTQLSTAISVLEDHDSYFVPGIQYYAPVFIGKGDSGLGTKGVIDVNITVTTAELKLCHLNNPPNTWLDVQISVLKGFTIPFDEAGYAALLIPNISQVAEKIDVELSYGTIYSQLNLVTMSRSPLKQMRIATYTPHGNVGNNIFIEAVSTIPLTGNVLYQIFAKGIMINSDVVGVYHTKNNHYNFTLTAEMVPKIYVTVTYVTQTGFIMSDYLTVMVNGSAFQNKVSVSLAKSDFQPGEVVNIHVSADPNSTVYMMAEDERNRLLGSYNDVYYEEVETIAGSMSDKVDTYKSTSQDIGVQLLTDAHMTAGPIQKPKLLSESINNYMYDKSCFLKTTLPPSPWGTVFYPSYVPGMVPTPAPGATYAPNGIPTPAPGQTYPPARYPGATPAPKLALGEIVRSKFPEIWIWESFQVNASGFVDINRHVPDSMTSWVFSTMATNPTTGFGITKTKPKITVKKNFFVSMDLPDSIIQGEEFLLQVTVFNYLPVQQMVFVQVESSDNPTNPIPLSTSVKPNQGHSTYLHFTPSALGTLSIKVTAKAGFFTTSAMDSLVKNVTVLPHGVRKTDNEQHLVDVNSVNSVFTKTIVFDSPKNMVTGTRSSSMTVTGNFMVPSIDGLQNLIRMPYGCGEQTMLNFAPDIFITKYLKTVGKLTDAIRSKSQSVLESGYQREMQYRHNDGSFSAFGNRDNSGSSWLTAFVLKCFHQAEDFLKIDQSDVVKGLNWLLKYQHPDGSFYEPGRIIHTEMQAGTSSGTKLTAFILISLIENRHTPNITTTLDQSISKGTSYLESKLGQTHDVYTLSLLCYALAKAGSASGSTCYTKLKGVAILDGDKMYWKGSSHVTKRRSALAARALSADIEATSYSLLTYLSLGKASEAFPIVKWLVGQRNPNGGMRSTQDTIISLQALSEFSSGRTECPAGYGVQFNAFGAGFSHTYSTTPATCDVVHAVDIPDNLQNVIVQAMGNGSAVIDVSMSYYVSGSTNDDHIGVGVSVLLETKNSITVEPCISWKHTSQSGMIVMEVEMPTGFQPDNDQLKTEASIKRHETNGRRVNLYFDNMQFSSNVCVRVKMDRRDPVVKSQACHVTAYDYYEPIHQATTRYETGILKNATICDVCPLCPFCTGSFSQIGIGK